MAGASRPAPRFWGQDHAPTGVPLNGVAQLSVNPDCSHLSAANLAAGEVPAPLSLSRGEKS
ncbi:hypothetical protein Kisp01_66380 [Kineosporia sp. NBRC 101677]|nr:hypothetical protein Kisp01_66380 [Kineosporia sp. NBRC 101677]